MATLPPLGLPPPMTMNTTAIPPPPHPVAAASNVVLLRNVPEFLQSFTKLRDVILPCGAARKILVSNPTKMALVTMMHGDGALKLVCAVKYLQDKEDAQLQAQLVPASPDIPLPVPQLEESITKSVGEELWNIWTNIQKQQQEASSNEKSEPTNEATTSSQEAVNNETTTKDDETLALDSARVAAAAGGGYDEDADPLNAPAVLEAVKKFRSQLLAKQGQQRQERKRVVAKMMEEMLPIVKQQLLEQQQAASRMVPPPVAGFGPPGLPPPPPPSGMAPPFPPGAAASVPPMMPPSGLPPPPPPTAAAGVVPPPPVQADEPPAKRAKIDKAADTNFVILPESLHAPLRAFISFQIKELLGEEEATLIDFIHKHVVEGKTYAVLQEELAVVLEEDAPIFVASLKEKVSNGMA